MKACLLFLLALPLVGRAAPTALRFAFDMVKRPKVRIRANLPLALRGQFEENLRLRSIPRTQGAWTGPLFFSFRMTDDYPTASDWVLAQFH